MLLYSIVQTTLHISTKDGDVERIPKDFFYDNFRNSHLKKSINEICISGKISGIGESAFRDLPNLKIVRIIPDIICNIASNAFSDNMRLLNVEMNNNILSLGPSSFEHCPSLINVKFSESLVIIGHRAFADDVSLNYKNINIPYTLNFCDESAFDGSSIDMSVYLEDVQRSIHCRNNSINTTTPAGLHYKDVSKYKREVN